MISPLFLMKGTRCLVRLLRFNRAFPQRSSMPPSAVWPNEWLPSGVGHGLAWSSSSMTIRSSPTCRRAARSVCPTRRCACGDDEGPAGIFPLRRSRAADASPAFPPFAHAPVTATAGALVSQTEQPRSRQSTAESTRRVHTVLERPLSQPTVWRTLKREARLGRDKARCLVGTFPHPPRLEPDLRLSPHPAQHFLISLGLSSVA